jgi:hypothetical protein
MQEWFLSVNESGVFSWGGSPVREHGTEQSLMHWCYAGAFRPARM